MARNYQGTIFTPSIRAAQARYYGHSRDEVTKTERDLLTEDEEGFIAARDSFYIATVTEDGWPYVQHRGGRPGFLNVLDEGTLAFADYRGNRQLITTGNLSASDRVALFLMDYPNRARLKILGHARIANAEEQKKLIERITNPEERPLVERVMLIEVQTFDWNCSQYITPRFSVPEVEKVLEPFRHRIAELEKALRESEAGK
jgi:predicted pyridoxine 5'-phosphate oxidase superfamily flavin-nucleotide-binding protein